MKLKVIGADKAFKEWDAWLAAVEAEAVKIAIDLMYVMLREAALRSPQYSGDMVANYNLSINTIDTSFQPDVFEEKKFPTENPFRREDMPAIMTAISRNATRLTPANVKLGDTLWLANTAAHDGDTYAWKVQNGTLRLRPENAGGYAPLTRTKEYIQLHYSRIGRSNKDMLK